MPTGSRELPGGIVSPSLGKFGEYLRSNCLEDLTDFFQNNSNCSDNNNESEQKLLLIIHALIENDKDGLVNFFESTIDPLNRKTLTCSFTNIRSLKNALINKLSGFTN